MSDYYDVDEKDNRRRKWIRKQKQKRGVRRRDSSGWRRRTDANNNKNVYDNSELENSN